MDLGLVKLLLLFQDYNAVLRGVQLLSHFRTLMCKYLKWNFVYHVNQTSEICETFFVNFKEEISVVFVIFEKCVWFE